jgi:hypothetical protein
MLSRPVSTMYQIVATISSGTTRPLRPYITWT